jgi:hypothetical protein
MSDGKIGSYARMPMKFELIFLYIFCEVGPDGDGGINIGKDG